MLFRSVLPSYRRAARPAERRGQASQRAVRRPAAGFAASFITGCLACKFMIEIVKRGKLIWFSLYCALAGLVSILSYFC